MSFAFNLDNGVPIDDYLGNELEDRELLFLLSFLEEIVTVKDVRVKIKDTFKLSYLQSTVLNVQAP